MNEQGVPNLDEMDEQQASRFLTELLPKLRAEEEYEIRHEGYVMEMPQSGERIRAGRRCGRSRRPTLTHPPCCCDG